MRASKDVPKVSVIMSVYNGEPFVRQAVESILGQTFTDFEFLVVDDGSTDGTPDYLAGIKDPRLVVIRNDKNIGLTPSLNRAIRLARGEYLARQDADDVSLPERLEKEVAYLDAHPTVGLVGTRVEWIDEQGHHLDRPAFPTQYDNAAVQQQLLGNCCFSHGSVMFRRQALQEAGGGYNEAWNESQDWELWLRMTEGWDGANLEEPLYRYRWHNAMASVQNRGEQARLGPLARDLALQRRLKAGWAAFASVRPRSPIWMQRARREWLARRYTWWSAGARAASRRYALLFLVIALAWHPFVRETWQYVGGILRRKLLMPTRQD